MMGYVHPGPSHCRIISIPGMLKFRELSLELTNEWEGGKTISHHCHRIPLCNTFLAVKEVTSAIAVMDHKCTPVMIGIETKLGARGPLMSNNPQHGCPIELIESIAH